MPKIAPAKKHRKLAWHEAKRGPQGRFGHRTMMARATIGQFQIETAINRDAPEDAEGDDEYLFLVQWYPLNRPRETHTAYGGSINWHEVTIGGFLDLDEAKAAAQRYADTHELKRPPRRTKAQMADRLDDSGQVDSPSTLFDRLPLLGSHGVTQPDATASRSSSGLKRTRSPPPASG